MKRNTIIDRMIETDARLERINQLQEQLAIAAVNSRQHRRLRAAIRIEANAYRKSLDTEQATATHDTKPRPAVRRSLERTSASGKPVPRTAVRS